ncbi:MAG: sensor domain-containing diguanylate cyclase [Planctomycetota bacterium]
MNTPKNSPVSSEYDLFVSAQMESEALKERLFELYLLYSLSQNLNVSLQLNELFHNTINVLKGFLKIEDFCFMLIDDECNELKMWKADEGIFGEVKGITFKIGEGVSGLVAQTGETILIPNIDKDPRFLFYKGKMPEIGSFLSIPLKLNNDKVIGVLNVHKRETNAFKDTDKMLFTAIAHNVAIAIERARNYENVQRVSMVDELTTLYTRRYFLESSQREYSQAERCGEFFSIILVDIDHFKYFNDTYGHMLGDEVLRKLSAVLKLNVRQSDVVARYGGEEFIILLPGTNKPGAVASAEKLRSAIEKELTIEVGGGYKEKVTITAGVACYPEDGKTVEEITAAADRFLYLGKNSGRNKVVSAVTDTKVAVPEKREANRYLTALKIVSGLHQPQAIEIKADSNWKMCTIKDISKMGFRGEVEFAAKIGNVYSGKMIMNTDDHKSDNFSIRVAFAKRIRQNRYQIGAEIVDGRDNWKRLFTQTTH